MTDETNQAGVASEVEPRRSSATCAAGDCIVNIDGLYSSPHSRATTFVNPPTLDEKGRGTAHHDLKRKIGRKVDQQVEAKALPDFETIHHQVDAYPEGYPMLAAFQSSDPAFSVYRNFEYLHSRVLLDLQYELSELEQELRNKDDADAKCDKGQRRLISRKRDDIDARKEMRDDDGARTRRQILTEIRAKLVEYDEVLIKARETATFQRPNKRDYKSVTTWFMNWKPLIKREWLSLRHQEDMLTLRQGREWAGFDGFIERMLNKLDCKPVRWIFQPRLLSEKTNDENVHYYDAKRVEAFVALIITLIIFILLVLPVVLMYELTSIGDRPSTFRAIGVLVVFTLLFSAAMSLLTKAKRHELFGASAAYCAVLVVFISNFNGSSDGPTTR